MVITSEAGNGVSTRSLVAAISIDMFTAVGAAVNALPGGEIAHAGFASMSLLHEPPATRLSRVPLSLISTDRRSTKIQLDAIARFLPCFRPKG
jgi:hypothetical protein